MEIAGIDPSPCVMTDERGNRVVIRTTDGHWLERLARAAAVEFGGTASSAEYPMTAAQARERHRARLGRRMPCGSAGRWRLPTTRCGRWARRSARCCCSTAS